MVIVQQSEYVCRDVTLLRLWSPYFADSISIWVVTIFVFSILTTNNYHYQLEISYTVKPVYNDHLYSKIYYLWFIQ